MKKLWISLKTWIRYIFRISNDRFKIPNEYSLIFQDDFTTFNTSYWRRGQPWGDYHPDRPIEHYDKIGNCSGVYNNTLELETMHNPKIIDNIKIPYEVGLIASKHSYHYGIFKADIILPVGYGMWPAFWLTGADEWPPEIDILEGYTDNTMVYSRNMCGIDWIRIQPNVHYKENSKHEMVGAIDCPVWDATNKYIEYTLWWEKDFIRIYYAGKLVREVADKKVLADFNHSKSSLYIVFNVSVLSNQKFIKMLKPMYVKNVKVYSKESKYQRAR